MDRYISAGCSEARVISQAETPSSATALAPLSAPKAIAVHSRPAEGTARRRMRRTPDGSAATTPRTGSADTGPLRPRFDTHFGNREHGIGRTRDRLSVTDHQHSHPI